MALDDFKYPASFKGRSLGVFILALVQLLVGTCHAVIGLILMSTLSGEIIYSTYTFLYGILTVIFAYSLWMGRRSGWLGTILLSIFVIIVDFLVLLNMPLIPGVPRNAAFGEILYSLVVLLYLFQPKIINVDKEKP